MRRSRECRLVDLHCIHVGRVNRSRSSTSSPYLRRTATPSRESVIYGKIRRPTRRTAAITSACAMLHRRRCRRYTTRSTAFGCRLSTIVNSSENAGTQACMGLEICYTEEGSDMPSTAIWSADAQRYLRRTQTPERAYPLQYTIARAYTVARRTLDTRVQVLTVNAVSVERATASHASTRCRRTASWRRRLPTENVLATETDGPMFDRRRSGFLPCIWRVEGDGDRMCSYAAVRPYRITGGVTENVQLWSSSRKSNAYNGSRIVVSELAWVGTALHGIAWKHAHPSATLTRSPANGRR